MERTRTKSYDSGFTVVELLMVIAIIALMAGATGGLYIGSYKSSLVRKAARDFELLAKYARMTAIERQQTCTMRLDVSGGAFMLVAQVRDKQTQETNEMVLRDAWVKPVQFEGEVKFEMVQIGIEGLGSDGGKEESQEQRTIVFRPDGTSENAVVQIGDGKTHYTVTVTAATGRAKTAFGTGENVVFTAVDLDHQMY